MYIYVHTFSYNNDTCYLEIRFVKRPTQLVCTIVSLPPEVVYKILTQNISNVVGLNKVT